MYALYALFLLAVQFKQILLDAKFYSCFDALVVLFESHFLLPIESFYSLLSQLSTLKLLAEIVHALVCVGHLLKQLTKLFLPFSFIFDQTGLNTPEAFSFPFMATVSITIRSVLFFDLLLVVLVEFVLCQLNPIHLDSSFHLSNCAVRAVLFATVHCFVRRLLPTYAFALFLDCLLSLHLHLMLFRREQQCWGCNGHLGLGLAAWHGFVGLMGTFFKRGRLIVECNFGSSHWRVAADGRKLSHSNLTAIIPKQTMKAISLLTFLTTSRHHQQCW